MATWPASLPQELNAQGFNYTKQDQLIRTEMDAGPTFVRRRFTAAMEQFGGSVIVDATQYSTFWTFFDNTINGGVDEFTWVHPVTGSAADVRFAAVPSVASITGGFYRLSVQLEILP